MRRRSLILPLLVFAMPALAEAGDANDSRPVAPTRLDMKAQLEASKRSQPRLPLPPPTPADLEKAKARAGSGPMRGIINNGRMRELYLPSEFLSGGFPREPDPAMTLSNAFKTEFFWIVSRANNCAYCQGHQEVKLSAEGLSEDKIAALDGDWSEFTPAERAAFAFTKKLTFEPQAIRDADLADLRAYYKDVQILEIILTVAGNNAMNRWTGALAIPQEDHREFLTPTSDRYKNLRSLVAPLAASEAMVCARTADRGALANREEVEAGLASSRKRTPRLPIVDDAKGRALLAKDAGKAPLPHWERLLLNFPKAGPPRIAMHRATEEKGKVTPRLRAEIAWVAARNDRAWYALGHARRRLQDLGLTDDAIFALDDSKSTLDDGDRLALAFAKKLTVDPALVSDGDVAGLRKFFTDHVVAEIIFQVTEAAFFDRLTEASGLTLED